MDAAREAVERTVLTHLLRPWTRTFVRSLPGTASRAVADAASGASERPTSQVVSPTTCDNIVNAVKVVDGFKGDVVHSAWWLSLDGYGEWMKKAKNGWRAWL